MNYQEMALRAEPTRRVVDSSLHPCACGCGVQIRRRDKEGTPRQWVRGHHHRKADDVRLNRTMKITLADSTDAWLTHEARARKVSRPALIRSLLQRAQEAPTPCG